jgi:hypothetical protein
VTLVTVSPPTRPVAVNSVPAKENGSPKSFLWLLAAMVNAFLPMEKDRLTSGAGLKLAFPVCEAVIVHEPAETICTVLPESVQ